MRTIAKLPNGAMKKRKIKNASLCVCVRDFSSLTRRFYRPAHTPVVSPSVAAESRARSHLTRAKKKAKTSTVFVLFFLIPLFSFKSKKENNKTKEQKQKKFVCLRKELKRKKNKVRKNCADQRLCCVCVWFHHQRTNKRVYNFS